MGSNGLVPTKVQRAYKALAFCISQLFPESEAELLPSRSADEGGIIIVRTNQQGYEKRYECIAPIRDYARRLREEEGIAFGFDVVVRQASAA